MVKTLTKEVTVGELRRLYKEGKYDIEIDTPDGFQPVVSWWDKGVLPMVHIKTVGGLETICATNHLVQCVSRDGIDNCWILAEELTDGDHVLTINGIDEVASVKKVDDQECYDFEVGHVNHRYWGDGISSHNSGKSYIGSANIIKWCQANDVWPVLIDTENAIDSSWLEQLGVDTSEDAMDKFLAATVDDVSRFCGELIDEYRLVNAGKPYAERGKMVIILDSLGMLITPTQEKQFMEGDQRGDLGIKAKQVTAMLRVLLSKIASQPIGMVLTNHVFDSQDKYTPDSIAGGKMVEFSTSVIIQMNKWLLKEDEDGRETKDVLGIKTSVVVRKSRYAKPFEKLKINIPYEQGMDPYSGLFDLFKAKGLFIQTGTWYTYTSPSTGEVIKLQGSSTKKWKTTLDLIMDEWTEYWEDKNATVGFDETLSGFIEDSGEIQPEEVVTTKKESKKK